MPAKKRSAPKKERIAKPALEEAIALKVGAPAPDFSLQDKDGTEYHLKECKGAWRVIYFYPKDSTPGCTLEAREFTRLRNAFIKADAIVIGISGGDNRSKEKFCEKNALNILLLSDPDFSVARRYGVYGKKLFMGRAFNGIHRVTFIVDAKGKIRSVITGVKPIEHPEKALTAIASLR